MAKTRSESPNSAAVFLLPAQNATTAHLFHLGFSPHHRFEQEHDKSMSPGFSRMAAAAGTRNSWVRFCCLAKNVIEQSLPQSHMCIQKQGYRVIASYMYDSQSVLRHFPPTRCMSRTSLELKANNGVVRFSFGKPVYKAGSSTQVKKRVKMSKKAKLNELRFYRLKAKKKINSPNPEVRIRYKLEKAKRKEAWLIKKLTKFEVRKAPAEAHDPESLTEEEKHYLKRTGEKKKNYVPVGRRGVFGGVVLNMHLHWKNHETVKVVCKPCKPGQVHEYADELARLSKGIVIDIKSNNTIIFYRGKNYVQPKVMSPPDTLSKNKALEKYRYEQSLEHTSQFIEKLEKELEEYHQHLARFKNVKEDTTQD